MVIATLANKPSFTPLDSAALQRSLGGLNSCGTNSLTVFVAMAHREGLQGKVIGTDFTQAKDTLARGGLVMASVGPGNFTHGTHWIVIRGITSDGKLLVANPLMGGYVATTLDIAYDANTGEFPFNQGMVAIWP
jgi:hypothetical protein